jgi:hypothetical protein
MRRAFLYSSKPSRMAVSSEKLSSEVLASDDSHSTLLWNSLLFGRIVVVLVCRVSRVQSRVHAWRVFLTAHAPNRATRAAPAVEACAAANP